MVRGSDPWSREAMKLRRGWIGIGVLTLVLVVFIAALTGFYVAAQW